MPTCPGFARLLDPTTSNGRTKPCSRHYDNTASATAPAETSPVPSSDDPYPCRYSPDPGRSIRNAAPVAASPLKEAPFRCGLTLLQTVQHHSDVSGMHAGKMAREREHTKHDLSYFFS